MNSRWVSVSFSSLLLALVVFAAAPASGKVFHTQRDALALAFPGADRIERRNVILTDAQAEAIEALAKAPVDSRIVTLHVGWKDGQVLGYAMIEVHTVRTLPEALMIVLTPGGKVRSVRMLAFHEPADYLPSGRWLEQFDDRRLGPDLQIKRDIHVIAGATLSSRAATRSVRRALAVHVVLVAPDAVAASGD